MVFFHGLQYICCNVGDSRAMIARGPLAGGAPLVSKALSIDHKPSRPDERARVQQSSAKILSETALRISGGDPAKLYICRVHEGTIRYGVLFTRRRGVSVQ